MAKSVCRKRQLSLPHPARPGCVGETPRNTSRSRGHLFSWLLGHLVQLEWACRSATQKLRDEPRERVLSLLSPLQDRPRHQDQGLVALHWLRLEFVLEGRGIRRRQSLH